MFRSGALWGSRLSVVVDILVEEMNKTILENPRFTASDDATHVLEVKKSLLLKIVTKLFSSTN